MSQTIKYAVGIDVSKDKLDVCFIELDTNQNQRIQGRRQFSNTAGGHKELDSWSRKHQKLNLPIHFLVEATGIYHEQVALYLQREQHPITVVLPSKARSYMKSIGLKTKNDKIDAWGLARMCAEQKHAQWQPMAEYFYKLRQLTRYHQRLQEMKTSFANMLHAFEHSGLVSKEVVKYPKQMLKEIQGQLEKLEQHLREYIYSDADVARKVQNITRIKGLGLLTVATVIAETNGFALFSNIRQLVKYCGYDVIENESGTRIGRTRISKQGNNRIRRILYLPALSAVNHNQKPFVNLFNRVYERTGIKMKGYVAVQKKLLVFIYALWVKDEVFQENYDQPQAGTSGNEEPRALFPLSDDKKLPTAQKKIVPPTGSTTLDGHRYNESPEALFPLVQT